MLKVLELFSGIGCQAQALKNIGVEFESTCCEIDTTAQKIYNQIHGETKNLGDITKVDENELSVGQFDLITFSSPCQDFSKSGLQKGGEKGSGTRSSLLWECERIIKKVKPKYLLFENVKNLVSPTFFPLFEKWLKVLEDIGYTNYYKVLNSKDFGVPQNRERIFCVSILGEHKPYEFPKSIGKEVKIKDILEKNVSEKYILCDKVTQRFRYTPRAENVIGTTRSFEKKSGYARDSVYDVNKIMGTLLATDYKDPKRILISENPVKIRKLTPLEYYRLMGFKDSEFNRIHDVNVSQLYKTAGNGIVVNVLEEIFRKLLLSD